MPPVTKVGLKQIFELQDVAADIHLAESDFLRQVFSFVSDAIGLGYEMLHEMSFPAEKQTAIRTLAGDSLSHIVVGFRIALWGTLPESMSVLRGPMESSAQLLYIVENQLYSVAVYELQNGLNQLSFDNVKSKLGHLGKAIAKTHGRISQLASHSTHTRLSLLEYELGGLAYDRLGFAHNLENTELPSCHCMAVCTEVLWSVWKAYSQEGCHPAWEAALLDLINRGQSLRDELVPELHPEEARRDRNEEVDGALPGTE